MTRSTGAVCCLALASLSLCGCVSLCPRQPRAANPGAQTGARDPHLLRVAVRTPAQPRRFTTLQKCNPIWWFGNADDPVPPKGYRPRQWQWYRNLMWHLRNPFHNFDYYVIGIADKPFTRSGPYPWETQNPHGGWNWAVCRYKFWQLPFIDYHRGKFEFYFGWRTGGNFGIKLNFSQANAKKPRPGGPAAGVPPAAK